MNEKNIYYTLRFAAAMCFIGHGAFGIITKEIWCNYFAVFGIGREMAYRLMPLGGTADILMGLSLLLYPTRLVIGWLVLWGCVTAFLRPLSGEPFAEFIERAGNYGVPLALLILCGWESPFLKNLFSFATPGPNTDEENLVKLRKCLQLVAFMVLLGHGGLNVIEKKGIIQQYTALGFSNPAMAARIIGVFEVAAAFSILISPVRAIVLVLLIWKMGAELFYPHWELFEWIERGGSYGALLALWFALPKSKLWTKSPLQQVEGA
ncbi:MAG TPA: hypothetical protein VFE53_00960 [Mucilaginibacter sp.]|nr:hypothetical protein [Mucilaginibacter sp.]